MDTLINKHDTLEQLIYNEGIRIQTIDVHTDIDLLLVVLNTGAVLQEKISSYAGLKNACTVELLNYKLIGNGAGIHWPGLDEDLSLKGFLRDTIRMQIIGNKVA